MHTLPTLPYSYEALEPYIDTETMRLHHTKHHQTYIDKLNAGLEKFTDWSNQDVEELLINFNSLPEEIKTVVRNHGGGHANHSLFWQILRPAQVDNQPEGVLKEAIDNTFSNFSEFKAKFTAAATGQFGSGWAWLVKTKDGNLEIISRPNQDSPLLEGLSPILGLDVWEHAYYLKYQNRRAEYIDNFFLLINWAEAESRYLKA